MFVEADRAIIDGVDDDEPDRNQSGRIEYSLKGIDQEPGTEFPIVALSRPV